MAGKTTVKKRIVTTAELPAPVKAAAKRTAKLPSTQKIHKPTIVKKPKPQVLKRPIGKTDKYTTALADEVVLRISGGEPLRQICRDEHMPHWTDVYEWQNRDKIFAQRIAHARELGEEAISQECMEIADNAHNDWMEVNGREGETAYKLNGEHVQRSKLRIETRLKLLAKWNPRKWGEKVDLNHGVQPENPLAELFKQVMGTPFRPADEKK